MAFINPLTHSILGEVLRWQWHVPAPMLSGDPRPCGQKHTACWHSAQQALSRWWIATSWLMCNPFSGWFYHWFIILNVVTLKMKSGGCHMLQLFFSLVVSVALATCKWTDPVWIKIAMVPPGSLSVPSLEIFAPLKSTVMLVQRGLDGDVNMCLWE